MILNILYLYSLYKSLRIYYLKKISGCCPFATLYQSYYDFAPPALYYYNNTFLKPCVLTIE